MLQASSLFFSVSFTFLFPHLISSDTLKKIILKLRECHLKRWIPFLEKVCLWISYRSLYSTHLESTSRREGWICYA